MKIPTCNIILSLPVGRAEMDAQSTTDLRVNGVATFHPVKTNPYGSCFQIGYEGEVPLLRKGDLVSLETRHAAIDGRVIGVEAPSATEIAAAQAVAACFGGPQPATSTVRYTLTGSFSGREGALVSGLTAIGGYRAQLGADTLVCTSASSHPVRWADYRDAKRFAAAAPKGQCPFDEWSEEARTWSAEEFRSHMRRYLDIVARGGLKPWIPEESILPV